MYKIKKHVKSSWVSNDQPIKKEMPWGYELSWSCMKGLHGKTLAIQAGKRTSLKYHNLKTEILFLRSGIAKVEYGTERTISDPIGSPMRETEMYAGSSLKVQSGCPYRITAIDDCEFYEIGDNMSDSPIRIEDDYGRDIKK